MQNPDSNNAIAKVIQGRIVWKSGDLFKGRADTVFGSKTPKVDKQGKQSITYGFGLAVPKMVNGQPNAQLQDFMQTMYNEALKLYPSGQIPPAFAFKFKDGDGIDPKKGTPYNTREGYAGCYVFSCTTQIPINWFIYQNGQNMLANEGIKCGDYVDVQVQIKAHPAIGNGNPGMYLNPNAARLIGYGEEITAQEVDGDAIFGTTANVPQGASSQPVAPSGGFPGMATPQQMQQQPAQPHFGILPQHMQPQQQQQSAGFPGQQPVQQQFQQPAMPNMGQPIANPPQQSFAQPQQQAQQQTPMMNGGFPGQQAQSNPMGVPGQNTGYGQQAPQQFNPMQQAGGFPGQVQQAPQGGFPAPFPGIGR